MRRKRRQSTKPPNVGGGKCRKGCGQNPPKRKQFSLVTVPTDSYGIVKIHIPERSFNGILLFRYLDAHQMAKRIATAADHTV